MNEIQHNTYHDLRTLRTDLDNLVLSLSKGIRENTVDGHDSVETLRVDVVTPATKIVSEYRFYYELVSTLSNCFLESECMNLRRLPLD